MENIYNNLETLDWPTMVANLITHYELTGVQGHIHQALLELLETPLTKKLFPDLVKYYQNKKKDKGKNNKICLDFLKNALQKKNLTSLQTGLINAILSAPEESEAYMKIRQYISIYNKPVVMPIVPILTSTNELPGAGDCIKLGHDSKRGRHITAVRDIKNGETLFIEAPSAFLINQDFLIKLCHYCGKTVYNIFPCRSCNEVVFCSEQCYKEGYRNYHHIDCGFIEFLQKLGVAHIALRCLLSGGNFIELKKFHQSNLKNSGSPITKILKGGYSAVYHLECHQDSIILDADKLQYAITALLLVEFLQKCTDYFPDNVTVDDHLFVAETLVRHMLQLIYNAHAVVNTCLHDVGDSNIVGVTSPRVATGIFPSTAMMNHSCDPNIITSFYGNILVVRASRDIKKGDEVFNCYGPHYRLMSQRKRLETLYSQYRFICNCLHCKSEFDFTELLTAYKCKNCNGPLMLDETVNKNWGMCWGCKTNRFVSEKIKDDALSCSKTFHSFSEGEDVSLETLISKWRLAYNILYCINDITMLLADAIAKKLSMTGDLAKGANVLESCLPAIRIRFGDPSPELHSEVVKVSELANVASAAFKSNSVELAAMCERYAKESKELCLKLYGTSVAV